MLVEACSWRLEFAACLAYGMGKEAPSAFMTAATTPRIKFWVGRSRYFSELGLEGFHCDVADRCAWFCENKLIVRCLKSKKARENC